MSDQVRDRVGQNRTILVRQIRVSGGAQILVGRSPTTPGVAQEITLGTGLSITGGALTLAVTWNMVSGKPSSFAPSAHSLGEHTTGPDDGFGVGTNEDGGKDLTLWNDTQQIYQRIRLAGSAGNENLTIDDAAVTNAALFRTAAEGDPNIPDTITITGSMVGASLDPIPVPTVLSRVADVNDFPAWEGDNSSTLQRVGVEWILDIGAGDYQASNDLTEVLHPGGMTGWTIDTGSGEPTLSASAVTATHLGQYCIVGNVNPVIYQALNPDDLSEWMLVGPYGVVEDNENPGSFRRIIFDGGAISSETYTPAD